MVPSGAEDGNTDGDGDADGGESVRRDIDEGARPGARMSDHGGARHDCVSISDLDSEIDAVIRKRDSI